MSPVCPQNILKPCPVYCCSCAERSKDTLTVPHRQTLTHVLTHLCPSSVLRPSEEMVKMVLSRPCHPDDHFTTSLLRHWAAKYDDTLSEHIKAQLIKNNNQPRKRQR